MLLFSCPFQSRKKSHPMTSPNHRLYSNEGHNVNVTKSVPSMSSIYLTYRGTSSSHRHYQVVSCHLWDVFPFLLEGYTQLDIVHRMWMSATNRLIKDVPSVSYWGQIRGICWKIKHTDVFCRNSLHTSAVCNCRAEKWSIHVTNNGMQLCAMSMGYAHPNQHASPPPPPTPIHHHPPCATVRTVRWWRKHSAPLGGAMHRYRPSALWSWKRDWRGHSSMDLLPDT